jgi:ethanolamine utilization protein EutQ (cupin superfamily)
MSDAQEFTVTLTVDQICMTMASLEVSLEDSIMAAAAGDPSALLFIPSLKNLIAELHEVRYGE